MDGDAPIGWLQFIRACCHGEVADEVPIESCISCILTLCSATCELPFADALLHDGTL
jgi:hypothetical protein